MATPRPSLIVPQPHNIRLGEDFPTPDAVLLEGEWAQGFPTDLPQVGVKPCRVEFCRSESLPAQAYELELASNGGRILAADRAGAWNALQTVSQWWLAHRNTRFMRAITVHDQPDFVRRGVTLDISRCRIPTMDSLRRLIDTLAGWKINQLQLYTEHTFAYAGHETVWRDATPLTAEDVRQLVAYAAKREVQLVPNQNSLGHFHRWLKHARYRHLAECPDGIEHPFSSEREPYGLCPTDPAVFELLSDLYGQLLPNFDVDRLNVGCDEPIDLGTCRSEAEARARGKQKLYLDYVLNLRAVAERWGRKIEIWADAVLAAPEIVGQIPADVRLQVWGYEAGHDFAAAVDTLIDRDFDLCPGTSSWASLGGRTLNALANIRQAASVGVNRATGLVTTDWGDFGHPQPPAVSMPGFLAGADCAWNAGGRTDDEYRQLVEQHIPGAGATLFDLGRAHEPLATANVNGTPLFHLLFHWRDPLTHDRYRGLAAEGLERVAEHLDALAPPASGHPLADQVALVRDGLGLGAELGLQRLRSSDDLQQLGAAGRRALTERLASWRDCYAEVWLSTSRSGGLSESVAPIDELVAELSS